jgi:hypothetical protein
MLPVLQPDKAVKVHCRPVKPLSGRLRRAPQIEAVRTVARCAANSVALCPKKVIRFIDSFYLKAIKAVNMKDAVRRLNSEYQLNLSEEEIDAITKQAEASQRLFQKLFEVDVEGVAPALKIDPAEKK